MTALVMRCNAEGTGEGSDMVCLGLRLVVAGWEGGTLQVGVEGGR